MVFDADDNFTTMPQQRLVLHQTIGNRRKMLRLTNYCYASTMQAMTDLLENGASLAITNKPLPSTTEFGNNSVTTVCTNPTFVVDDILF